MSKVLFWLLRYTVKLVYWIISFALWRFWTFATKKGVIYFALLLVLMNLDLMAPALGGKITSVFLIFGPFAVLAVMLIYRHARDASPDEYFFFASSGIFIGCYGLLKAWSAAAGTDVPFFVTLLGKAVLGTLGNIVVGSTASVLGYGHYTPFPLANPEGLLAQFGSLNPLLTGTSLLVLITSIMLWINTSRRHGQWDAGATELERSQMRNRMLRPDEVNSMAVGWWANVSRQTTNLFQRPRIPFNHIVVGMLPPVWKRPWALPFVVIGYLMIFARVRPEATIFDPRPLIVLPSEGSLIVAGKGGAKTQTQIANLVLNNQPVVTIETQLNAFSKELPIAMANGRTPIFFAPQRGMESASLDYLAGLDPASPTFSGDVSIRTAGLIDRFQKQYERDGILVSVTIDLIEAVMGNVVALCAEQGLKPTLLHIYEVLTDSSTIRDHLADWAENGHPTFRRICRSLINRLADPEYVNSMEAIWGPQLRFLDDPTLAKLVSGGTKRPFDPRRLLSDGNIDVVIQIEERLVEGYGALLRLLLLGVLGPRMALNEKEALATPAKGLHLWIDELAALKGARICDQLVVFGRQKGFTYTYCMQSIDQVAEFWPEGTFERWADSSDVLILGKSNSPRTTDFAEAIFGKTASKKKNKASQGNYSTLSVEVKTESLVTREKIDKQKKHRFFVWARSRNRGALKFVCDAPVHFKHPALGAFLKRARQAFAVPRPKTQPTRTLKKN